MTTSTTTFFKGAALSSLSLLLLMFIMVFPAFSQERSGEILKQLEKKEAIPKPEEPSKAPVIQEQQKPTVEEKAAGEKIFVKAFDVQGATLLDLAVINAILAPYNDRDLALAQMNQAADAVTAAYRQKGFLTAYAYIPAQDIKDGMVVMQIMEGKIGNITVTGNRNYTTGFITGHLDKTDQDLSIKEQTLVRALLLLNDYPTLTVNASLKPGVQPGTTDIAVTAADTYPISASLSYDNFGTKTLSKHRLSLAIDKGNTITEGDDIRLSGVTGLDRIDVNKLSYGRIDYMLPLDYDGTKAGIYYANSLYEAGSDLTPLKINGKADVAGVYVANPVVKTADTTLTLRFAFDYKDIYDYMLDTARSQDRIRTITFGINYDTIDRLLFKQASRNIIAFSYNRGIQNITGGTGSEDQKASRLHADPEFNKYTLEAARIQKITQYTFLIMKGGGQYSPESLFVAEQHTIGGAGSVRGHNQSSYSGDSGYNVTLELQTSPLFADRVVFNQRIGDTVKLALFADNGGVWRNDRQPGEAKDDYLTSIGAGIRLYYGKYFSARLDQAWPEKNGGYKNKNAETYLQMTMGF